MKKLLYEHDISTREVEPLCPVFGECQGCSFQNIPYADELALKERILKSLLEETLGIDEEILAPVVPSPKPYHYRNRLDLKLKRTLEKGILIGFTPVDRRGVLPVDACFIADENISAFIPELKKRAIERLPKKYRVANLVVRTGDDGRVFWGGIGRRSCELSEADYLWTEIGGRKIFYSLDTFFQANLSILPKVIDVIRSLDIWAQACVFYDLYGGVGFFGINLADKTDRVVLIEENPASLRIARHNVAFNKMDHFDIVEGRVEDRLEDLLATKGAHVAMIDPPRAGLSGKACEQISSMSGLDHILYLSCNPESLARDLKVFVSREWKIKKIIPFDFFPKTKHLEALAVMSKR